VPVSHARAAVWSLLVMLADITDPRDPRGARHPLVAVLGAAMVAALAGAANYRELGTVAAGLPQELLSLLGTRWDLARLVRIGLPHATRLTVIRRDVADLAGRALSKGIVFVATSRAGLTAAEISAHTRRHWGSRNLGAPALRHRLARG
jgi:hypothetical protein